MDKPEDLTVKRSGIQARMAEYLESTPAQWLLSGLIVINAALLGLGTAPSLHQEYGLWFDRIDHAILIIFVVEIGLKLWAKRGQFFKSGWNVFDAVVVGVALLPLQGGLGVIRAFRILRLTRLVSMQRRVRAVIEGFFAALPSLSSVIVLMVLFFYIFGVITTTLYAESHPQIFGNLGASLFSLFQLMTMDGGTDVVLRPLVADDPWSLAILLPFIILMSFTVLNLVVGILVSTVEECSRAEVEETDDVVLQELKALRVEMAELRASLRASTHR